MAGVRGKKLVEMSTRLADLRQAQAEMKAKPPVVEAPPPETPVNVPPVGETPVGDMPIKSNRPRAREIYQVQDGQSLGEQAVYRALWNAGRQDGPDRRIVSMGYAEISYRCGGMDRKNVRLNLKSLVEKKCVTVLRDVEKHSAVPKLYAIHHFDVILKAWRTAGLTHVERSKGAKLVGRPSIGGSPVGDSYPVGESPIGGMGETPHSPIGETPTKIRRRKEIEEEARRVLADPEAGENVRLAARSVLGEN